MSDDELETVAPTLKKGVFMVRRVRRRARKRNQRLLERAGLPTAARLPCGWHDWREVRTADHGRYIYMLKRHTWWTTNSRAFHRAVLADHQQPLGEGAVRRPALRRNGSVGAGSLRRGFILQELLTANRTTLRTHQNLRGYRQRRSRDGAGVRNRSTC